MDSTVTSPTKVDVHSIVTNRIIELLEKGTIPWQQPWADAGIPMNLISKRPYRGINLWLLLSLHYGRNLFLTWDQIKKLGGNVKRGEHGHLVVFWKTIKVEKPDNEEREAEKPIPLLRYYKVFNIEQCEGLLEGTVPMVEEKTHQPISTCESIVTNMPLAPAIRHKEQRAFYHPLEDYINMPKRTSFKSNDSYYATLFHELAHSTGHEKRLNRKSLTEMARFGSEPYSFEELVAELGAAFLCSSAGTLLTQISDSAAYIKGWLTKLKNDKRFIVQASGAAQKAVDYILNHKEAVEDNTEQLIEEK